MGDSKEIGSACVWKLTSYGSITNSSTPDWIMKGTRRRGRSGSAIKLLQNDYVAVGSPTASKGNVLESVGVIDIYQMV